MKLKLLIIALLLSSSVMAQKPTSGGTHNLGPAKNVDLSSTSGTFRLGSLPKTQSSYWMADWSKYKTGGNSFLMVMKSPGITLMKISDIDSTGTYKVWFDKRAIKYTSDSTFTLQAKP